MNNHGYLKDYVNIMKNHGIIEKDADPEKFKKECYDVQKSFQYKNLKNPTKQEWENYITEIILSKKKQ